jgi:parallel beta-helix repeat protein
MMAKSGWRIAAAIVLLAGAAGAPGQGGSIQDAIDSASPGDTILVNSGVYHESVNVTKALVLLGNDTGRGLPVVDARGRGSAITLSADGIELKSFRAAGSGNGSLDAGIKVVSKDNIVEGNLAQGNGNAGILLLWASNNTVAGNAAAGNGKGIVLVHSSGNLVAGNNASWNDDGIAIQTSRENTIRANNVTKNGRGIVIINRNDSESITASGKGVSIKYRPEVSSYNASQIKPGSYGSNVLYGNRLMENGENARDDGSNQWYDGRKGNRYSNYDEHGEGCKDRNKDGVCDAGFSIPGGSCVDRHPLASGEPLYRSRCAGAELGLERSTYQPGGEISLKLVVPANFSGWVGIVASDLPRSAGKGEALSYLEARSTGLFAFPAPSRAGSYELRLYSDTEEIASLPFQVAVPAISASPAAISTCEPISVSYLGAPGLEGDWIGLYRIGSPDSLPISRQYLDGSSSGTLTFSASEPGSYNLRIFEGDGYRLLAATGPVEVRSNAGVKVVAAPARVSAGGAITVTYWGAPASGEGVIGMYGMTTPDKFWIEMRSIGGASCGSLAFRAPADPGRYDFRMFEDNVYRKLMGQSNSVEVG